MSVSVVSVSLCEAACDDDLANGHKRYPEREFIILAIWYILKNYQRIDIIFTDMIMYLLDLVKNAMI